MGRFIIASFMGLCFICLPFKLLAQQYHVLSINGIAEWQDRGVWKPLIKGNALNDNNVIRTSKYGILTLLDDSAIKKYAIQSEYGEKIEKLVATQRIRNKSLSKVAYEEARQTMLGKEYNHQVTRPGVSYRGNNIDELLASWLVNNVTFQSVNTNSTFPITLKAISLSTKQEVDNVQVGESVELMIINGSDEAIYYSVIDIDANGVWSVVFEESELIPPHSEVMALKPIKFSEPRGTDYLLLLAYTEMYNPNNVINLYKSGKATESCIEVGCSVISIDIR